MNGEQTRSADGGEAVADAGEERFRNIIENMQEFVVVTDPTGVITMVNPSTVRLLGYAGPDELLGTNAADTVCDSAEECQRIQRKLALLGTLSRELVIFKRRDGSRVVAEGNFRMVMDRSGMPLRMECVGRDMTERQGVEDLQRAKEEAEASTRAKIEFLANTSHELRTPLNAIVGFAHLLGKTEITGRQRELLGKLQASANGLLSVIGDLLDFSKIEAGKLDIETREFEVATVLNNVANTMAARAKEKGVQVCVRVEPSVPQKVVGDALRLGQVLLNLVGSALKFTDREQVTVVTELADRAGGLAHLRFTIHDNGAEPAAAPPESTCASGNPGNGATPSRQSGGSLGLAISKQLVALMGGSLALESEAGRGLTFSFTIKVGLPASAAQTALAPAGSKLHVLAVDDSLTGREVLRAHLAGIAHHVCAVASGTEALEELHSAASPYDLVLLDWYMEDMDGPEVARRIKASTMLKRVPRIIMVTGNDEENVLEEARALGVDGFVSKPLDEDTLRGKIEVLFGALFPEAKAQAVPGPGERPVAVSHCGRLKGRRILVVDDDDVNREVAKGILEGGGLAVVLAEDGRQAVELLARDDGFDAVLMDVRMPVMDGLEATRAIRSQQRNTTLPIIALTAEALVAQRAKCFDAGMDEFLTKPIAPERIFEVLERMLAHRPPRALARGASQPPASATAAAPTAPGAPVPSTPAPLPKPATSMVGDALPGLDTRAALRRLMGNRDLYARLLRAFAGEHEQDVAHIREAIDRGDVAAARAMAHKLKGVAGNLSATQVFAIAARVETLLRESQLAPIDSQLDELDASMRTVTEAIATLSAPRWEAPLAAAQ